MTDQTTNSDGQTLDLAKIKETQAFPLETGKLFTVKTPDGLISETGTSELQAYLYANGLGALPADFEPTWCTKRGTLPKRLTAHCYKVHGIKLTGPQISEIGNIAKRHTSTAQEYILDFTQRIDWNDGDFGDGGSCYWGSNSNAPRMIEENGGYAVRLWKYRDDFAQELKYDKLRGYARAWIARLGDDKFIMWNGYGETSLTIARILSVKFACNYKRIVLRNNGSESNTLYINSSSSFVLGQWAQIESVASHDFEWDEPEKPDRIYCSQCDDLLGDENDDDISYALDRHGDNVPVCDSCHFYCERCQENYVSSLGERVLDGNYRMTYCPSCAQEVHDEMHERESEKMESEAI